MILKYGGYINDNVTVQEKQGELSILSSLPEDNQEDLIILPDACLPRIGDFVITAHDEKLIAEPKSHYIKKSHTTLMRLMIEIYNITNKLSKHRDTNPWLSLEKSPSLMQKLFEGRAMDPKMRQYYEKYKCNNFNEILIDTFIGSRTLSFKSNTEKKPSDCMMPFIDFVNHFFSSPMIHKNNDKNGSISIKNFLAITGSQECFVHYNMIDPLDSFLVYGFVDDKVPFVKSVPLQFKLHEYSHIQVHTRISSYFSGDLPDSVQDLRAYLPIILEFDDSVMQLSRLLIPGENAPRALRRVLELIIRGWKPMLDPAVVKEIVINAEKLIIRENIEYYTSLSSVVETLNDGGVSESIARSVKTLVVLQLDKLHNYMNRINSLG